MEQIFKHLVQTEEGRKVAGGLIDKFKMIEEKLNVLDTKDKEQFDTEYQGKIKNAFESLNEAVGAKIEEEALDQFHLTITFLVLFSVIAG